MHQLSSIVSNGICNTFSCSLLTTAKVSIEDKKKKTAYKQFKSTILLVTELIGKSKLFIKDNMSSKKNFQCMLILLCDVQNNLYKIHVEATNNLYKIHEEATMKTGTTKKRPLCFSKQDSRN